jgi:ABC-type sugar transport system substrate-binding protein
VQNTLAAKHKIAFLFDVDHPFYSPTKAEAAKAAGVYDYSVSFFAPQSRDDSAAEQAAYIDKIIKEKYDGLIISPINDDLVIQKLRQAVKAGIKIIFLNAKLDDIEHVSLIMTDGVSIGAAAARIVMGALGNHGEAIVNAWSGLKIDAIENRKDGFVRELKKNSMIAVHEYPVKSNPTPVEAETIISSMLKAYPNAQFLYLTNLDWGMYAAEYMRKSHSHIQVITVDFSDEVGQAIQDGALHYSLGQRAYLWGSTAVTLLDQSFHGRKVQKCIDTGTFEINKLNVGIYSSLM